MTHLPKLSGRKLVRVLEQKGFVFVRQKGSHMMLRRMTPPHLTISVPDHKELAVGTLRSILRDAEITTEELNRILDEL